MKDLIKKAYEVQAKAMSSEYKVHAISDSESDSEELPQKEVIKSKHEDDTLCKGSDEKGAIYREEKGTNGLDQSESH